jgi:hypothetical protein
VAEKVAKVVASEEKKEELKEQVNTQMEPLKMKAVEQISGPSHVDDVDVQLEGKYLSLKGWTRLFGLRLSPYLYNFGLVDNQDAAEAFMQELNQRKKTAPDAGRFFGPLDYWVGWLAVAAGMIVLFRWPRKKPHKGENG